MRNSVKEKEEGKCKRKNRSKQSHYWEEVQKLQMYLFWKNTQLWVSEFSFSDLDKSYVLQV